MKKQNKKNNNIKHLVDLFVGNDEEVEIQKLFLLESIDLYYQIKDRLKDDKTYLNQYGKANPLIKLQIDTLKRIIEQFYNIQRIKKATNNNNSEVTIDDFREMLLS